MAKKPYVKKKPRKPNRLWHLVNLADVDDYTTAAMVIRAPTERKARQLAQQHGGAECDDLDASLNAKPVLFWTDPAKASCKPLRANGPTGVIV